MTESKYYPYHRSLGNRNFQLFLFISFYFLLFQPISISAQTDSLPQYLEISIKNNPGILQKLAEYEASLQKIPQVGGLPDPELSTGIFLSPMELVGGNQLADIRLMQMFPWFGVLKNAKDEMSLMAKAKFELFRDAKLQLCYEVQKSWLDLYKNKKAIAASEKNREILQSLERLILTRFKTGSLTNSVSSGAAMSTNSGGAKSAITSGMNNMGGRTAGRNSEPASSSALPTSSGMAANSGNTGLTDLYRVQMELSDLENAISRFKNEQMTLIVRFNTLLNRRVQQIPTLPDTIVQSSLEIPLQAIEEAISANSPMLGMLKNEQLALEARRQMVARMGYPMIGLGLNYSLIKKNPMSTAAMNGKDMIMPMVTVTLPIYRKKYEGMQKETELLHRAAAQGIISTENALRNEFYSGIQAYRDAQDRLKRYEYQIQLAAQSMSILTKSFAASGAGLTDLLRVRQQLLDYNLKLVEAVTDFNDAIARIKRVGNIE